MSRILLLDIGAGTMDVLYYDSTADLHYKAVVRSPVRTVAEHIADLSGNLVVTGGEMGGGPVTDVLRERARTGKVVMSTSSAATLHHDPDVVRSRTAKRRICSSNPNIRRRQSPISIPDASSRS